MVWTNDIYSAFVERRDPRSRRDVVPIPMCAWETQEETTKRTLEPYNIIRIGSVSDLSIPNRFGV